MGAEITPSAFNLARVPALPGRPLVDDDERDAAAPAMVLGYDLWRKRFSGDPNVIGRPVHIGAATSTVVGVMPEGFAFPVNHEFWVPLRASALSFQRREGPAIQIFGRLAPNVTLEDANAEIAAIGLRTAADFPATHEHLRPRVVQYTALLKEADSSIQLVQFIFVLLLLVLASNVATMVFARTATREHEIAMRFALGSSRGRIVGQFFVEALVLALIAAIAGLSVVAWGTNQVTHFIWDVTEGRIPFWLERGVNLNVTTVLYAIGLAVLAALVAGVIPALKATQSRLQSSLRHAGGAAGSALRFGGLWSAMIVIQVAFAVLVLPPAIVAVTTLTEPDHADPGFAAEEFLSARLEMDVDAFPQFQSAVRRAAAALAGAAGDHGRDVCEPAARHGASRTRYRCRQRRDRAGPARIGDGERGRRGLLRHLRCADPRGPRVHPGGSGFGGAGRGRQRILRQRDPPGTQRRRTAHPLLDALRREVLDRPAAGRHPVPSCASRVAGTKSWAW